VHYIEGISIVYLRVLCGLGLLGLFAAVLPARAQELTVATAADLRPALEEIASRFQASSGAQVKLIYGSSGNFYQQIQSGAPFDFFFSANADYAKKLESAGLTVPGTYYEYARGRIVLMVPAGSSLDLKRGLSVLLDPAVKKIAIADPSHAPYGQAAVSAIKAEKIYDQVSAKLVTGENISQAASLVLSGAADAGIVALSLALSAGPQVRFAEIPASDYPPIQQACVVLRSSKNQDLAARLESYIRSDEVAKIFERFGFEVPASSGRAEKPGP
jgi:molybdate transport system substrate-binding protein